MPPTATVITGNDHHLAFSNKRLRDIRVFAFHLPKPPRKVGIGPGEFNSGITDTIFHKATCRERPS